MMRNRISDPSRRQLLGMTAGTLLGSGISVTTVSADSEELSQNRVHLLEIELTYDGKVEDTLGREIGCGIPNYIIDNSNLYLGGIDIEPYMNRSEVLMVNSGLVSKSDPLTDTTSKSVVLNNNAGIKERLRLQKEIKLPEIRLNRISEETVTLDTNGKKIHVESHDEKTVGFESQSVEVEYGNKHSGVSTKELNVTPKMNVSYYGRSTVYGIDNGMVLPNNEKYPRVRRARRLQNNQTDIANTATEEILETGDVILIRKGGE